ncbi:MAG: peptidase [Owenweeksia sp.]|nr:peptidase [Owenweeksia sp.]MBF97369.1 peptidase [Owenweeksia sp.]HBF21303.1 peptidase [Cryomorphaceae bacterium]|tara:strand:- start:4805 stop:5566 length:762 start_codon:yes stop_codon:yes gene_type:complete
MKNLIKLGLLAFVLSFSACKKDDDSDGGLPGNNLNTGASARDILSADRFGKITVEIQYPAGFAPDAGIITNLKNFISTYCHKPDGIEIVPVQITTPAAESYDFPDVREIEKNNRTVFNKENELALYLLFSDKEYSGNEGNQFTLGAAYQNTSTVIFMKTIRNNSGGFGQPSEVLLASTVLQHELGHLMGLVNLGADMQQDHEDKEHEKHCNEKSCLMYWAVETQAAMGNIVGMNTPPDLDAQCRADIRAKGGK